MLKYETPLEYDLLLRSTCGTRGYDHSKFWVPSIEAIETIAQASSDVSFKKAKFKRYLEEYREHKNIVKRPKQRTKERMAYYCSVRNRKLEEYIACNTKKLKKMTLIQ